MLPPDLEREPLIDGQPLHDGQRAIWQSGRRILAIFAGWRSGKTELGPHWFLREMQRCGPGDYAVIAPTYPLLDNKSRPALLRVLKSKLGDKAYTVSGDILTMTDYGQLRLWGEVRGDTRVLFRHGTRADAIEAFDGIALWVDEAGQLDDDLWEAIQARVSISQGRILMTSRPYRINYYVKLIWRRVCDRLGNRLPTAPDDTEVVNFPSIANPAFPAEEFEKQRNLMPAWKFALKFLGLPTKPAGAVYDCFNPWVGELDGQAGHLFRIGENEYIPPEWPRYMGVDFGPDNTAALKVAGEREWIEERQEWGEMTGRFLVYAEYHGGGRTPRQHIAEVMSEGVYDPERRKDFSAWGGAKSEEGWRGWWAEQGLPVAEPIIREVELGIMHVYAMFRRGDLLISDSCTRLIEQLESYSYKLNDEGDPVGDGSLEILHKSTYHLADALRYVAPGLVVQPISGYSRKRAEPAFAYNVP